MAAAQRLYARVTKISPRVSFEVLKVAISVLSFFGELYHLTFHSLRVCHSSFMGLVILEILKVCRSLLYCAILLYVEKSDFEIKHSCIG
jgi:hypothetical protein